MEGELVPRPKILAAKASCFFFSRAGKGEEAVSFEVVMGIGELVEPTLVNRRLEVVRSLLALLGCHVGG